MSNSPTEVVKRHSTLQAVLIAACLALAGCQTLPTMNENETQVRSALQAWAVAFNECDVDKLAALYAAEGVLWGTVSQGLISSPEAIREYFQRACAQSPQPKVALGELLIRTQADSAVSSGMYTFTLTIQGQSRSLPARFSFAYRKDGQSWLVVSHHSSLMPAAPIAAVPAPGR